MQPQNKHCHPCAQPFWEAHHGSNLNGAFVPSNSGKHASKLGVVEICWAWVRQDRDCVRAGFSFTFLKHHEIKKELYILNQCHMTTIMKVLPGEEAAFLPSNIAQVWNFFKVFTLLHASANWLQNIVAGFHCNFRQTFTGGAVTKKVGVFTFTLTNLLLESAGHQP
jgi:hypothetical protein